VQPQWLFDSINHRMLLALATSYGTPSDKHFLYCLPLTLQVLELHMCSRSGCLTASTTALLALTTAYSIPATAPADKHFPHCLLLTPQVPEPRLRAAAVAV
jgi:hypothetical protein